MVEARHDWVIPSVSSFISEVSEYERKPGSEIECDHESEVWIIRGYAGELLEI